MSELTSAILISLWLSVAPVAMSDGEPAKGSSVDSVIAPELPDPVTFFDELVRRYRNLVSYSDYTSVVQITRTSEGECGAVEGDRPAGGAASRIESRMICDIIDGELRITTPGSQLRDGLSAALGLEVTIRRGQKDPSLPNADGIVDEPRKEETARETDAGSMIPEMRSAYQLWLAPHMVLKFAEDPMKEFRVGTRAGFTATDASAVTVEDREMVHLELRSGPGDGASADAEATFDLYVNRDSMLIERIEGREQLPDGGSFETSMMIVPTRAIDETHAEQTIDDGGLAAPQRGERGDSADAGSALPEAAPHDMPIDHSLRSQE